MSLADIFCNNNPPPKKGNKQKYQKSSSGFENNSLEWILPYIKHAGSVLLKKKEKIQQELTLCPIYEASTGGKLLSKCRGEELFQLAMISLDSFKWKRSPDQKRFHDAIFMTSAPHIYKSDFLTCRDKILDRFGRDEFPLAAMIMTPRRWGKTTASAMAAAVLMYVGRKLNILVFSTGQRMSTLFAQKVKTYFCELPGASQRILVNNTTTFEVASFDSPKGLTKQATLTAGFSNKLSALASTVKGTKGVTADIIILEEASRIPQQLLSETCAPLLKVANAVLIALSTRLGPDNYYSKLFARDDDLANRILLRLKIELMCESCKSQQGSAFNCTHLDHLLPPWLLASNSERVQILMDGDEEMYAQEVLGTDLSGKNSIFNSEDVRVWRNSIPKNINQNDTHICLTMIDPAGGGSSQTALVSIVMHPNLQECRIIGLSEMDARDENDMCILISSYFRQLKTYHPRAKHVVAVENNYGGGLIADILLQRSRKHIPTACEVRTHVGKPGVVTTQQRKHAAVLRLSYLLRRKSLGLVTPMITYEPGKSKRDLDELQSQLHRLRKITRPNNPGRWSYTGKMGNTGRDDMCISLILAVYYLECIQQHRYNELPQRILLLKLI
jgi:hypothetical protein